MSIISAVLQAPLFRSSKSPMYQRLHVVEPDPRLSNLVVVLGDNASGKSLVRRELEALCDKQEVKFFDLSMEHRSKDPWERSDAYGDEEVMSTGMISASSVCRTLSSSKTLKQQHVVFMDEPDVGLSDEVAAGLGQEILQFAQQEHRRQASKLTALVVVTHRQALLSQWQEAKPVAVFVGDNDTKPKSLTDWLNRKIVPRSPRSVIQEGVNRFSAVSDYLSSRAK